MSIALFTKRQFANRPLPWVLMGLCCISFLAFPFIQVARQAVESLSEFVVIFCFIDKITIFKVMKTE